MILNDLCNELFTIEHLSNKTDGLKDFKCSKGIGLEHYLKEVSLQDELSNIARTYIIRNKDTMQIVAYFSLRTGLITISRGFMKGFNATTGIELANFAVNDNYKEVNDDIPKLGSYIFWEFILPLVQHIQCYVGAKLLYIYALPYEKLLAHYSTMGFTRTDQKMERFVYRHVKPNYDKDCIFMYQII